MKTGLRLSMLLLLAFPLLGCVGQTMRIDNVANPDGIDWTRGRRISARAQGFQLLSVIPLYINSRHERAFEALLKQADGDAVADVTIQETWAYGVLGTSYTTVVEAMAYPRKSKPYREFQ